jgi:hypothetical protein
MAIINDERYCPDCKTDEYIWYTWMTDTYQCDACWDDGVEAVFKQPRQYGTPRERNVNA